MITKTAAVREFLKLRARGHLAQLYTPDMECQVNVAQDGGQRITGEFKGKNWHGYSDGATTWKSFRIPLKANTEPEYTDTEIKFDLQRHVEGIGLTGWDWKSRVSRWVAFDFDAISGHKHNQVLSTSDLQDVISRASTIPWVTILKSTSGKGLHLYVHLDPTIPTANHTEHASLARSILAKMSALTGFSFQNRVDICGGNMWIWHRKMEGTDGLTIIKTGENLSDIPTNWREHVPVICGKSKRVLPKDIPDNDVDRFDNLSTTRPHTPLDIGHRTLINYLETGGYRWWWDADNHMLITHTTHLRDAHNALKLRGCFDTVSTNTNKDDHNCFCFPLANGAWAVRRYGRGCTESKTWQHDGKGWTRCYLNREPTLETAATTFGGLEDPTKGYSFASLAHAVDASRMLGIQIECPPALAAFPARIYSKEDGSKLVIEVEAGDVTLTPPPEGWLLKRKKWYRVMQQPMISSIDTDKSNSSDELLRHLVTDMDTESGWALKNRNGWQLEPLTHVQFALKTQGNSRSDASVLIGEAVMWPWRLVNIPFQPEYPGDRQWNRGAAQFKYVPLRESENLSYPMWSRILKHCGSGLDDAVQQNNWCQQNQVLTGADYLKLWIASVCQRPYEPLPYLFFFGNQNSGKSIFHEAISLLFTRGYQRADAAITNSSGFNGELSGAIVCVIEETDLRNNKIAYNRIKDWVTSRDILIHPIYCQPYHERNTTHWIQCNNDIEACPVTIGDTRINCIHVPDIPDDQIIAKRELITMLEKEAPEFLTEILNLELPYTNDRLALPVLFTNAKASAVDHNLDDIQQFLQLHTVRCDGACILFSDLYDAFQKFVDPMDQSKYGRNKFAKQVAVRYPKGVSPATNQVLIGNIWWAEQPKPVIPEGSIYLVDERGKLILRKEADGSTK